MALLLREAIGGTIRRARTERRRTLRDVSKDARVSLGYLSEIERGRKEPSSELLDDVADSLRPETPSRVPARLAGRRLVGVDPALRSAVEEAFGATEPAPDDVEAAPADGGTAAVPGASSEVVDLAGETPDVAGDGEEDLGGFGDVEAPEPAGELRVVELVTLAREPAGAVRSAA